MSLKEALFGFIDNVSLPAIFSRKAENLKELRQPLIKGISNAKRQFSAGQTRAPHRWWRVSNDVVALTVKVSGNVFKINGSETNHIPADRFLDFLDKFTAAVEAGEFDDELRHKGAGDAQVQIPKAKRSAAKPAKAAGMVAVATPLVEEPLKASVPPKTPLAKKRSAAAAEATSLEPKHTTVDAKTAHPRATKVASTRSAIKPAKAAEAVAVPEQIAAEPLKASAPSKALAAKKRSASPIAATSSKPKRKPVDAKTAYARATKAAATRAANKAKKEGAEATTDAS